MLLLAFFIVGSSIYRGLLNYLALNGWLSILLVVGVLLGNSVLLLLAVYGKIGYYPFFLVLSFLYYCSSYAFVLFDLANKLSYFTSLVTIGNASIYLCTFDLWLVLVNLLAAAVFIKFMVAIKHAVFISSLILFALAYLLLFLHDLLYTLAVILLYLLFSINAIGQLAAMKAEATPGNLIGTNQLLSFASLFTSVITSAAFALTVTYSQLPFLLLDLYNTKHFALLAYIFLLLNWLTLFACYPFLFLVVKLCGFISILHQSLSSFALIATFLGFVYQTLIVRLLFTALHSPHLKADVQNGT